jgi:hypothetical protein
VRAIGRGWAAAGIACVALTGCGDDDDDGAADNPPSTPQVRTTATTATAPATTPPTAPPGGAEHTGRERDEGGDEEPIRIPAAFTLRGGRLRPASVSVPAFLAIQVSIRNLDPVTRVVVVRADRAYRIVVRPRARAVRLVPGQRHGSFPVIVRGGGRATLLSGGEPGP